MAETCTIYTYPNNPRAWKSLIVAKYARIEINQPPFEIGKDNKTSEYLEKFPPGKVPALDTPDGPLFESNTLARYIARAGNVLLGKSIYEEALIEQWIFYSATELEVLLLALIYPVFGYLPSDPHLTIRTKKELLKALDVLNKHLLKKTYLVGESITLADIIMAMTLLAAYTFIFDPIFRKPFPNVTRWFLTIVRQPNVEEVIGKVKLCEDIQVAKRASFK